jgi:hypothetical protein
VFPEVKQTCLRELRTAVSTGAPFDPELRRRLAVALGLELHNAFGTTETMQVSSTLVASASDARPVTPAPGDGVLGTPLPGVRVYYHSPSGKSNVVADEDGQFGFETMALNEYQMEVHEKGYLPLLDKKSTGSVEVITRKILPSASSDQVTIRMRPVPSISGIVRRQPKAGSGQKNGKPVWGVDVQVIYMQGKVLEQKTAQTDPLGKFFVNLPNKNRGTAKVLALRNATVDVKSDRIPSRKPIELLMKPTLAQGMLVLSDASELSGVRVALNYFFPDHLSPERALRLKGGEMYTNMRGRFYLPAAQRQQIELVFYLPDGKILSKVFDSDRLLRKRVTFVYDPVSGEILTDAQKGTPRSSGQQGGQSGQQKERKNKQDKQNKQNKPPKQDKPAKQPAQPTP